MINNNYMIVLISLIISSLSLMMTLVLEYTFELIPCDLCLKQRGIHYIIFFISILCLILIKLHFKKQLLEKVLILFWVSSMTLAIYHFGIEKNFWTGFSECSTNIKFDKNTLKNILLIDPINCKDVKFEFLNVSLAGWNSFVSFFVLMSFMYIILFSRKDKYER